MRVCRLSVSYIEEKRQLQQTTCLIHTSSVTKNRPQRQKLMVQELMLALCACPLFFLLLWVPTVLCCHYVQNSIWIGQKKSSLSPTLCQNEGGWYASSSLAWLTWKRVRVIVKRPSPQTICPQLKTHRDRKCVAVITARRKLIFML